MEKNEDADRPSNKKDFSSSFGRLLHEDQLLVEHKNGPGVCVPAPEVAARLPPALGSQTGGTTRERNKTGGLSILVHHAHLHRHALVGTHGLPTVDASFRIRCGGSGKVVRCFSGASSWSVVSGPAKGREGAQR